jgi:FkbM family methyltransferase
MPTSNKTWTFPSNKDDLLPHMINGSYQDRHRKIILEFLKENSCRFRNCLDIGAHVGIWSDDFTKVFEHVHAFEPIEELRTCYKQNVHGNNYTMYPFGLGNSTRQINFLYEPEKSKNTQVNEQGNYSAEIKRLDDLGLQDIDYIKMDAEGYELEILKGGTKLLRDQLPFVHLEIKSRQLEKFSLSKKNIHDFMNNLGYKLKLKFINEYVFSKQ